MLREEIEEELLDKSKFRNLVTPDYRNYNFSRIPGTVESVLGLEPDRELPEDVFEGIDLEEVENVALVFVDAFGYDQWKHYGGELDFFDNMIDKGRVTPLTAVFPSETSAAVSSMNTGLTPQEHSVFSWRVFFEGLDVTLRTLPFTTLDKEDPREIDGDVDVSVLFDGENIFERLKAGEVRSTAILPEGVHESEYNSVMMEDAEQEGFSNAFDMALKLRRQLENSEGLNYFHCYTDQVDSALHEYGPNSEEHLSQLEAVSQALQKQLLEKISNEKAEKTLLVVVADHGQADVDPEGIVDLLSFGKVRENLRTYENGEPVLPTGGPRTVFLNLEEGSQEEVKSFLEEKLEAKIYTKSEALEKEFFGLGEVSHPSRLGNLIIIPEKEEQMIWYDHEEHSGYGDYQGHHGGMSRAEMLVPFATAKLSDLKD
jgi:predicted AlkP superfamily pyrophosphatase or phosphodiesterase